MKCAYIQVEPEHCSSCMVEMCLGMSGVRACNGVKGHAVCMLWQSTALKWFGMTQITGVSQHPAAAAWLACVLENCLERGMQCCEGACNSHTLGLNQHAAVPAQYSSCTFAFDMKALARSMYSKCVAVAFVTCATQECNSTCVLLLLLLLQVPALLWRQPSRFSKTPLVRALSCQFDS
jgi:hypothetical protein